MKRTKKTFLIIFLSLLTMVVLAAGIIPLIISTRYESVIERKLPGWIASATDSLYKVSVKDISISAFTKNITISGLTLVPDSNKLKELNAAGKLPTNVFSISIAELKANTIHWADLLADKEFSCARLVINRPHVIIDQSDTARTDMSRQAKTFPIERLSAGSISVLQPNIVYRNHTAFFTVYWKGGKIKMDRWFFDPRLPEDTTAFFYARKGLVEVDSAVYQKQNTLYAFKTGGIRFVSKENSLVLKNLSIQPAMSRAEYYRRVGYRNEIFSVNFPAITLKGFSWQQLSKGSFKVNSILADRPAVDIYLSRLLPSAPPKKRKFPMQLLQEMKLPVRIDTLQIRNAQLNYTELSELTKMEGTLPFKACNITLQNVTNMPAHIRNNENCTVTLRADLFGSKLISQILFPLKDTTGMFTATASLTSLNGENLNPLTKTLALMEIHSLNLSKANFSIACNGQTAKGRFVFLYDNLDLKILKVNDEGDFNGKGLMSFIMNKALLYPSNPLYGFSPREINVLLVRRPTQSFFNFLWSSIRRGALLTAGRNAGLANLAEK